MWCIEQPLKLAYPELYCIAYNKEAVVADLVHFRGDSVHWEVNFTRWFRIESLSLSHPFWKYCIQPRSKDMSRIRCVGNLLRLLGFR